MHETPEITVCTTHPQSPAAAIMQLVRGYEGYNQSRSNERSREANGAAFTLAVEFGIPFAEGDLGSVAPHFIHDHEECGYSIACGDLRGKENSSYRQIFETAIGRKPFMYIAPGTKTPSRIYRNRKFAWKGKRVWCTSFASDQESLTACSYHLDPEGYQSRSKVEKRFRITHEMLKEHNAAVREAQAPAEESDGDA